MKGVSGVCMAPRRPRDKAALSRGALQSAGASMARVSTMLMHYNLHLHAVYMLISDLLWLLKL